MSEIVMDESVLEVHYYFNDDSHTLDAFIQNYSEHELLSAIREIAQCLDLKLTVEVYPLQEGGLRQFFSFGLSKDVKTGISVGVVTAVISTIFLNPLGNISGKLIDKLFEDSEYVNLQRENVRLQNKNLKLDIVLKEAELEKNQKILIRQSNFYRELDKCEKIKKISFQVFGVKHESIFPETFVFQENFKDFILDSNELDPIHEEHAEIEIVSPVLKKGSYKWRGIYDGRPIVFSMKSKEFKARVQSGEINFKNGFSIDCCLVMKRELDENGEEQIKNYTVTRVNSYFVNGTPIETIEGKKQHMREVADSMQLQLGI